MTWWLPVLIAGGLILVAVLAPRGQHRAGLQVPFWLLTAVIGFTLGLGGAYGLFLWSRGDADESGQRSSSPAQRPPLVTEPLVAGTDLPPFSAHWLNGLPHPRYGNVMVLDIWDDS